MGFVCTWDNWFFPHETELTLRGRHLRCLAAVLNIMFIITQHSPHFFSHLQWRASKDITNKSPVFYLNMFLETKQSRNLGILCCTDPACPARYSSPTPGRWPYAKWVQVTQPPPTAHLLLEGEFGPEYPQKPSHGGSGACCTGMNSSPPPYNHHWHCLVQLKQEKQTNKQENAKL